MKLQSAEFDHTRDRFRRRGSYVVCRGGIVRGVRCLLTGTILRLCSSSLRRFSSMSVHFEGSSFAFLGSFFWGINRAKHGEKRAWAEGV